MKINKTKIDYIDINGGPYVSRIIHTVEYEPVYFSKYFRFLKEDLGYNDRNLEDIKRQVSIQIAEEIIDRMDVREETDPSNTCIDYIFTIRALDDKKARDFEDKINELERNLNIIQLGNNSLKLNNEELTKDNKIMKDKIKIIENGNFWSRLKFAFGVK